MSTLPLKSYCCCVRVPVDHAVYHNHPTIAVSDDVMKTPGLRLGCRCGFTLIELLTTLAILGLIMTGLLNVYVTSDIIGRTGANKAEAQQDARAAMLIDEQLRLTGYGYPFTPAITAANSTAITFWADLQNASTTLAGNLAAGGTTLSVQSAAGIAAGNTVYLFNGGQVATLTVTGVSLAQGANTITVQNGPTIGYPQGTLVGRPRQVTYSWNAQTLFMNAGDGTGTQPLSTGVQNLQFNYFDVSDVQIPENPVTANLGNIRRIQITVTAQSTATQNPGMFTITSSVRPRNL